jgi:hypothetical protein
LAIGTDWFRWGAAMSTKALEHSAVPSHTERRRSGRLKVVAPLTVTWYDPDQRHWSEYGETQDVSFHGALLRLRRSLSPGQVVRLIHNRTVDEGMLAQVVRCGPPSAGGWSSVAVKLAVPGNGF